MLAELLAFNGYVCKHAASGQDALAILDAEEPFDLCIIDIIMPGMSGWDLATTARATRPAMHMIAVSVMTHARDVSAYGFEAALQKPFTIHQITSLCDRVTAPPSDEDGETR